MNSRLLEERLRAHFHPDHGLLLPEPLVSRVMDIPATHPSAPASVSRMVMLLVAAVLLVASTAATVLVGSGLVPTPWDEPSPQPSPRAISGGVDAYLLAEGEGPGGPWSYWVWTAPCPHAGGMALWMRAGYLAVPAMPRPRAWDDRCVGGQPIEQPYVVELSGIGAKGGWAFVYGRTQLDVARVTVRTVAGREFEAETIAAPDGLGLDTRFYVMLIPTDSFDLTVRGYDASGHYVGGNRDERHPPPDGDPDSSGR